MIHLYRLLLLLIGPFYLFYAIFNKKTRAHLTQRPESFNIDTNSKKTIWVHASSGEFEHAKFLIKTLKENNPLQKIVVTYSSPSYAYAIQKDQSLDAYTPLPLDLKAPISSVIKKINPEAVLFARTDVWPELAHQLQKRKIPTLVFARAENNKSGFFKKLYYRMTLLKVSHISFVSERDKGRFISTVGKLAGGVNLSVDGDPRVDEVFNKIESRSYKPLNPEMDTTVILGSVWKEDLETIAKPLSKALEKGLVTKIIAAPHEPSDANIEDIKESFKGFPLSLFSENPSMNTTLVVVDQVGVLFDLYSEAKIAFVGGSFKQKVHSVLEPLANGLPVLTGPHINNNSEALTYSKKPYEFVRIASEGEQFFEKLCLSLKEVNFEIKETIEMQRGSSEKIELILQNLVQK